MARTVRRLERETYRQSEVARMTGLSRWTVARLIADGQLAAVKMPGASNAPVLIPRAALARFLDDNRVSS